MYLTNEHLGKKLWWKEWSLNPSSYPDYIFLLGFEPNEKLRVIVKDDDGLHESDTFVNGDEWMAYEDKEVPELLPMPIERLMSRFGCHEPQTRELVRELIKLIKEK